MRRTKSKSILELATEARERDMTLLALDAADLTTVAGGCSTLTTVTITPGDGSAPDGADCGDDT